MKKKIKFLMLAMSMVFIFSSCKSENSSSFSGSDSLGNDSSEKESSEEISYERYEYSATHDSTNNILLFKSSDEDLDLFLNDFFERHSRYSENRIHTHPVGAGSSAWKEWESLIGSWWDSSNSFNKTISSFYATKDYVSSWLLGPKQDKQGYIWCDNGNSPDAWGMGWAFPDYTSSPSVCCGFEFNSSIENWTSPSGAKLGITNTIIPKDGSSELNASDLSVDEISVESPNISITTFYSPFMVLGMDFINKGNENDLDDIYIYWQTSNDEGYSEEKCVKFSEFSTTGTISNGSVVADRYYLPMYVNESWGASQKNIVKKVKIVAKAKTDKKISGDLNIDYFRCEYDDRQANNCGTYITAAENFISYAQDPKILEYLMPKVRRAMQHYLTELDGANGLMSTEYYVGHDGIGVIKDGYGIGDGYWDVTSYPDVNMYTNIQFYRAVNSMIYLEKLCETYGIKVEKPIILGKDMKTEIPYLETAESLESLRKKIKSEFEEYFWDESTGRFIAGYYGGEKDKYNIQDNGYLHFNLEAISAGLGTKEQQQSIMDWVSGKRTVKGDDATGSDIYKFEFAPRNTTKQNVGDYCFLYGGCVWETGVHNGGAVMQTSYYDIIARNNVYGADDAFNRLKEIETWYEKVASYNGTGMNFYRAYYDAVNIGMQGGLTSGPVGLDVEFLEAALMYASIPTAFFGIKPSYEKALTISPSMPQTLKYWKLENLTYANYYYDLSIGQYFVQISGVRNKEGNSDLILGHNIMVELEKPKFDFDVYYNDIKIEYLLSSDKISVKVPFTNGKIEIIKK